MSASSYAGLKRLTKAHKMSIAGVAALSTAALAFSLVPGGVEEARAVSTAPVAVEQIVAAAHTKSLTDQAVAQQALAVKAKAKADADAKAKAEAAAKKARAEKEAATRSIVRKPLFANNLDGWIKEALWIMKKEGIPGTYQGIHRNIMRESSGNPRAINNWDINAQNGIPSKGLLQVIAPTFKTYHVKGTKFDQYDPVANIVAACNYAADRYGSMDNVNSAY